jgi:hypothetical protein
MENTPKDYSHIKGWGIDADPKNDPTYPMRKRENDPKNAKLPRPTQQTAEIEILKSNERPTLSAVFGTAVPPSGLSGFIRRFAFKHSENSYLHWLPLVLADRVNVVEGIVEDIAQGTLPNIWSEKGYNSEAKFNKTGLALKVAGVAVITTVAVLLLTKNSKSKKLKNSYS